MERRRVARSQFAGIQHSAAERHNPLEGIAGVMPYLSGWNASLAGTDPDFECCALMDRTNHHLNPFMLLPTANFVQDRIFVAEVSLAPYMPLCFASLDAVFGLMG